MSSTSIDQIRRRPLLYVGSGTSSTEEFMTTTTDGDTSTSETPRSRHLRKRIKKKTASSLRFPQLKEEPKGLLASLLPSFLASLLLAPPPQLHLKKTKTLVLDLDETLVHSTSMGSRHHDHIIEVMVDKHVCLYYVYKRPGVDAFLKKVAEWYKVVIFTASMPEYADPVIDWLDKDRSLISRRYFRQSCSMHENGHFSKDLSIVDANLANVVLLDNSPVSFASNP
ncbi:Nuclear envelope morphology protein 1, partial [Podochytrium sp. JEL0797]